MTRREFTAKLALLILHARDCGYEPFLEDVHRSDEEQQGLFEHGLSKYDGRTNAISAVARTSTCGIQAGENPL